VSDPANVSVALQWSPPSCLERNGEILQYVVTYGDSAAEERTNLTVADTKLIIFDLIPGSEYSFQVAAENSVGRGPFSAPVTVLLSLIGKC